MEGVLQRRCPWAMTSIANHDFSLLPIWPSRGSANLGERQERKEREAQMGWNPIERALPETTVTRRIPYVGVAGWRLICLLAKQRAGRLHIYDGRVAHVLE